MTQEEKELLLRDLSARLPYGVKVSLIHEEKGKLTGVLDAVYPTDDRVIVDELSKAIAPVNVRVGGFRVTDNHVKPYLRPMSSMTEEEAKEFDELSKQLFEHREPEKIWADVVDWLNKHHFDYRGLIEKGLAIEAPEGMYNIKEK